MKINHVLALFTLLFSMTVYSQDSNMGEAHLVASHVKSSTVCVHTIKLNIPREASLDNVPFMRIDDSQDATYADQVNSYIKEYSGVTQCSFDKATATYTVLTAPEFEIKLVIATLNAKLQENK